MPEHPVPAAVLRAPENVRIRLASSSDCGSILHFIRELAEYEREPDGVEVTEDILIRDGFRGRCVALGVVQLFCSHQQWLSGLQTV